MALRNKYGCNCLNGSTPIAFIATDLHDNDNWFVKELFLMHKTLESHHVFEDENFCLHCTKCGQELPSELYKLHLDYIKLLK